MQENITVLQKSRGVINMLELILSTLFFVAVITVIGLWILMFKDILRK
jgi:cell division protein FtsL